MKYLITGSNTQLRVEFIKILKPLGKLYEGHSETVFQKKPIKINPQRLVISLFHINKDIIEFAKKYQNKFLLLISSFGSGDSWPFLAATAKKLFGKKIRIKTLSEAWSQTSSLDYEIIHPARAD